MKTFFLSLIIKNFKYNISVICIIISSLGWNCNAQVSSETLASLYINKKFTEAIAFTNQIESSKNTINLTILGDCYYSKAFNDEQIALQNFNESMQLQTMAISQGLYIDSSFSLMLYQSSIQKCLEQKLKAIDLYTKASKLGYQPATDRLIRIGQNGSGNSSIGTYNQPSNQNNNQIKRRSCSYCNGTGFIDGTVATYGNTNQKWCDKCNRSVSASHCHGCKTCPSCNGKGYNESY